jgi:adenylate kinase family enzyme
MKISVIGGPGSGKSTLAKKVSDKLKIPYLQIDRLWFESGGNKLKANDDKEKVRAFIQEKVLEFIKQDAWISEGWYSRVQPLITKEADILIFLDIPLYQRIWNHLKRTFKSERHKELTKFDDLIFIHEIIRRQFKVMPKMRKFVEENKNKVKIFKNHKDADKYVSTL